MNMRHCAILIIALPLLLAACHSHSKGRASAAFDDHVALARTTDPAIEALNLEPTAKAGAYALKKAHPEVVFTSGRRDRASQARAMAPNVAANRQWIKQTYVESEARTACQKWVDDNPTKTKVADIEAGLAGVLATLTDAQLAKLSKHLSGEAFDVKPVTANADAIKKTIRELEGLTKFLDTEGGIEIWHAQF